MEKEKKEKEKQEKVYPKFSEISFLTFSRNMPRL